MSALDSVIEFVASTRGGIFLKDAKQAAAELAQLRTRNAELEEYHGFHMGIIPEGEPTVEEERLRAELTEARKMAYRAYWEIDDTYRELFAYLEKYPEVR